MKTKGREDCKTQKYRRLMKAMENEVLRKTIWEKRQQIQILERRQQRLTENLEDKLNIFTREGILEHLSEWETQFKEKIDKETRKRKIAMGMELPETELNKRVKTIGHVHMKEEERMFLALGKNFRIQNEDWKKEEILLDVEDIIHNERKEEEEKNRLRGKIIQTVERADRDRKDNQWRKKEEE